jgi:hypothetical protein
VVPGYSGALHYSAPVHGSHADATSRDKRDEIVTKDKNFNSYSEPVNILKHHSKLYIANSRNNLRKSGGGVYFDLFDITKER